MKITEEHAVIIRDLRCRKDYSWSAIGDWLLYECDMGNGTQMDGKEACDQAAELMGEDQNDKPWN